MSREGRPVSLRDFGTVWRTEDIFLFPRSFFAFASVKLPGGALPETSDRNDPAAAAVLPFPPATLSVLIDFFELFAIYMSSKPAKPLIILRLFRKHNLKAFAPGA